MKKLALLAALAAAALPGCGQTSTSPSNTPASKTKETGEAPALSADEKVMLALNAYDPMYQVNAKGRITRLKLPWRHLPDSVLAEINKLSDLERLDCHASTITDDGLAQLKDLKKLRNLGLGATTVTDKGLVHLEKMPSLRFLWVSKARVSEEAVAKLHESLPKVKVYRQ